MQKQHANYMHGMCGMKNGNLLWMGQEHVGGLDARLFGTP